MFTLRCTKRLLDRLNVATTTEAPEPTTLLGDWYANLLHVGRLQVVLAVSERTFLPVVVAAAPNSSLLNRIRAAARDVLRTLGVGDMAIELEMAAMESVVYGKTVNRQAIGMMVDFGRFVDVAVERERSLLDVSLGLAGIPCRALDKTGVFPNRATVDLFAANPKALVH